MGPRASLLHMVLRALRHRGRARARRRPARRLPARARLLAFEFPMRWLAAGVLGLCLPVCGLDRLALVVGDNAGLPEEKPLSYATRDAEQVYAALPQLGGLDKGQGTLLLNVGAAPVRLALKSIRERVRA